MTHLVVLLSFCILLWAWEKKLWWAGVLTVGWIVGVYGLVMGVWGG